MDKMLQEKGLRMTRRLNAPVALVWQVWTMPEDIAAWWGPQGFTNTIHRMDVAAGGEWRLTMHGPDGKDYPNRSTFMEIVPLHKIVFQHFNPHYLAAIRFEADGGFTTIHWEMMFETTELFETVVRVFRADEGLAQNLDRLEGYLAQKQIINNNV